MVQSTVSSGKERPVMERGRRSLDDVVARGTPEWSLYERLYDLVMPRSLPHTTRLVARRALASMHKILVDGQPVEEGVVVAFKRSGRAPVQEVADFLTDLKTEGANRAAIVAALQTGGEWKQVVTGDEKGVGEKRQRVRSLGLRFQEAPEMEVKVRRIEEKKLTSDGWNSPYGASCVEVVISRQQSQRREPTSIRPRTGSNLPINGEGY